jgi:anti-sigma28 factor (negative regulator of flagellin synthesis)
MHIHGATQVHGPHGLSGPHSARPNQGAAPARPQAVDQLEISPEAAAASRTGEVRTGLVDQIKAQIASGAYETPDKLDAALDRLLDQIG